MLPTCTAANAFIAQAKATRAAREGQEIHSKGKALWSRSPGSLLVLVLMLCCSVSAPIMGPFFLFPLKHSKD